MISRTIRIGCCATLLAFGCANVRAQSIARKRVAVLNFDNPSLPADAPSGLFGAEGEDVGKGVSVLLIEKLVKAGKYTVVDRSALEKLLMEQKKADIEGMDAYGLAARIGRLVGLDAMIVGGVTQYGTADQNKNVKAGGGPFSSAMKIRKSKARVEITAQVFNITTGQVMSSFVGKGESSRTGDITVIAARSQIETPLEMLSSEFAESLLPEATRAAVDQVAEQIDAFAAQIPVLHLAIDGRVADVAGTALTLNLGASSGVKVGEKLAVVRDPANSAIASASEASVPLPERLGTATITEVADESCTASFEGAGPVLVGDRVRDVAPPGPTPK